MRLCLVIAGCTNNDQKPVKSIESVTNMPPNMHGSDKYIQIDKNLMATKKDLSCGMSIKNRVTDTMTYNGKLYGFCGKGCKEDFAKDPLAHLLLKSYESSYRFPDHKASCFWGICKMKPV